MKILLATLLAVWLAGGADENLRPSPTKSIKPAAASSNRTADATEAEYEKLLEEDERAMQDVDKMVRDFQEFEKKGAAGSRAALGAKIDQRLEQVERAYDEFLVRHPKHIEALLAYGSFLNESGKEEEAIVQWEKARELDPNNPTPWNNLANVFGHIGPVKKAFQYYEKAIALAPNEPVYLENLATTVYLFRKDASETYRLEESQVFDKALDLYKQAMKLDPTNLVLATDFAQSYYGIKPLRYDDALAAWKHALSLAKSPLERQGIYLHLARVELNSGHFTEAADHLALVDHEGLQPMKKVLERNLREKQAAAKPEPNPPAKIRP